MVHGRLRKIAGTNPRREMSLGDIMVVTSISKFIAIIIHIGFRLNPWYLLYLITLFATGR
ncbi:hypothetical protein ES703_58524 [subsurface metagenome]